jgi:hypothetical protein
MVFGNDHSSPAPGRQAGRISRLASRERWGPALISKERTVSKILVHNFAYKTRSPSKAWLQEVVEKKKDRNHRMNFTLHCVHRWST